MKTARPRVLCPYRCNLRHPDPQGQGHYRARSLYLPETFSTKGLSELSVALAVVIEDAD